MQTMHQCKICINSRPPLLGYNDCTKERCIWNERQGMESLKMQTICWCKKPTDLDRPLTTTNPSALYSAAKGNLRKFRGIYLGTMIALMKGAYEK